MDEDMFNGKNIKLHYQTTEEVKHSYPDLPDEDIGFSCVHYLFRYKSID